MSSFEVHLNVRERAGVFYANCPEVPGLHIKGDSRETLRSTAVRAIKDLYQRNRQLPVQVILTDDLAVLRVRQA